MQHTEIIERVKKIVDEQLGVPADDQKYSDQLVDDLGADSLDLLNIIMAIEEEFNIEVSDKEAESINTVGGIANIVFLKKYGLSFNLKMAQLEAKDTAFLADPLKNPAAPAAALVKDMPKHQTDAPECPKDDAWNCKYCEDAKTCRLHSEVRDEPEIVKMRLTIDVEYRLNGYCPKDVDYYLHELVRAAVYRGMLTGNSPMEVETYNYSVERLQ
jgi:acyl carrier protein